MTIQDLLSDIKKKSKKDWESLIRDFWTDFRIWLQENGEVAALCAFIIGMLVAVTFKYVFAVAILLAAGAFVVWFYAEGDSTSTSSSSTFDSTRGHSVNGAAKNDEDSKS